MFLIDSIGDSSAQRIAELQSVVSSARQPDSPQIDRLLGTSLERVREAAVTISVVGQVKSGKSSLINALTGLGDFLPTEVNPWTAVITNLHFGHPDKPEAGGVFELFSEAEWRRMIEGNPETRQLAEELLPGFRSDVLQRQVIEMQENAKKRLGNLYTLLLGKKHRFNDITPEVLERYVSAGYGDGVNPESSAGRYSGITKSANVFMPAGPFRVPVTLSDTPGINDPFLVRDEITTSSFKDADAFIVALSAHQALGPADIALLKMLSVHSAKKTIVYVNRIDELDEPAEAVPELLGALDARLREEMEHPNYELLAGSAQWGRIAATGSDAEVAAALDSRAFHSVEKGLTDAPGDPRKRLYAGSGMKDLAACISTVMSGGRINEVLAQAVTECGSAVDLQRQALRERREHERLGLVNTHDIAGVAAQERDRVEQRIDQLSTLTAELETLATQGQGKILNNGDVVCVSINNVIETAVTSFVQAQARHLRDAMEEEEGEMAGWSVDVAGLCRRVEAQVAHGYQNGRQQIDRILQEHAEKLNEQIRPAVGDVYIERIVENLPFDEILPAFKPHSPLIEMEFSKRRGWRFWQSKTMSPDEAVELLSSLIRFDVYDAAESLLQTVREAVGKRNGAAMERLRDVLTAARDMIDSEIQTLKAESSALARGGDQDRIAKIYQERKRRAEELDERIASLDAVRAELDERFGDIAAAASWQDPAGDAPPVSVEGAR